MLILRKEENRRTWRKTLEARETPTTTTLLMHISSKFENQHGSTQVVIHPAINPPDQASLRTQMCALCTMRNAPCCDVTRCNVSLRRHLELCIYQTLSIVTQNSRKRGSIYNFVNANKHDCYLESRNNKENNVVFEEENISLLMHDCLHGVADRYSLL